MENVMILVVLIKIDKKYIAAEPLFSNHKKDNIFIHR
jgi:hypothetical protein